MNKKIELSTEQVMKNRALLGGQLVNDNGASRIHYSPGDDLINPVGAVLGGFLAAMLDDVMSMVTWTETERPFTSSQLNVSFLSAARKDDVIVAAAKVIKAGKKQAYVEGELLRQSDKSLIAKGSILQIFLDG